MLIHRIDFNETPLHNAVRAGNVITATMLLQAGANPALKNDQQQTPVDLNPSKQIQALFGLDDDLDVGNADDNGGNLNVEMPREENQMPSSPNAFDDAANRKNIVGDNGAIDDLDVSQELQS